MFMRNSAQILYASEDGGSSGAALFYPDTPVAPVAAAPAAPATPEAPAAPTPTPSVVGGEAPTGEAPAGEAAPPAPLTLESYEITLPETFQIDEGSVASFKQTALDSGLAPDKAQAFVNLYAKTQEAQAAKLRENAAVAQAAWVEEIGTIPDFQGERRTQALAVLGSAMKEFGSPEAAQILNDSGLGNHPAVVKYIYSMAKALSEGTPVPALRSGAPAKPSLADQFYPSMVKK